MGTRNRVGLVGHYHGGNQGDDIVVDAVIAGIRARIPTAEIVGFSQAPDDTEWRHGIPAHAALRSVERPGERGQLLARAQRSRIPGVRQWARVLDEAAFWWRSYRRLRGVDLLVVPGSGQLLDGWRGPRGHPYVFFGWSWVARLARVPMVFLCNGAGPVRTRPGRFMLRSALGSAEYVSFRDQGSADVAREIGVRGELPVATDLAFTLTPAQFPGLAPVPHPARARPLVGLNIMDHADPRHEPMGEVARYRRYVTQLAAFAVSLVEDGYDVLLFSSDTADPMAFADALELMRDDLGERLNRHVEIDERSVTRADLLIEAIGRCDFVVASRYHCALLAYLMGTPTMSLAYNQKTFALAASVGLGEYCLHADTFEAPELVEHFRRLVAYSTEARARLAEAVVKRRELAEVELDRVFGPRAARAPVGAGTPEVAATRDIARLPQ